MYLSHLISYDLFNFQQQMREYIKINVNDYSNGKILRLLNSRSFDKENW